MNTMIPTLSNRYDLSDLVHVGWTRGDGSGHDGYRWWEWFDRDGFYTGPDEHDIEPIFVECGKPTLGPSPVAFAVGQGGTR